MDTATQSQPRSQNAQHRAAESSIVRTAVKDSLAAMAGLVRRHSSTGQPTDAAVKAAARHIDISLSDEVRGLVERIIAARAAILESSAADDPQTGGFSARQITHALVDPTALMRLLSGRPT